MAQLLDTTIENDLTVTGAVTASDALTVNGIDATTKLNLIDTINTKMTNIMNKTYTLTINSSTAGSGWTVNSASAYLLGNALRIYFSATRSSSLSAGNNTNELIMTLKIATGGRIKNAYNISFVSGSTGPLATGYISGMSLASNVLTVPIYLAANAGALSSTNSYFIIPVILDLSAYD